MATSTQLFPRNTAADAPVSRESHITISFAPMPPFDFAHTLRFIGAFAPGEGEQQTTGDTLTRALRVNGQTVVCHVTGSGTPDAPAIACDLTAAAPLTAETVAAVRDRVGFWLSLNDDLRLLYEAAQTDAAFLPIIRQWYGYHQVKFLTPFENACWAVLATRAPLAASRAMKDRLVARYGDALTVADATHAAFPAPADLASATPADLVEILHNARKADYLYAVIQAWQGVDETWLRTGPYDDVERWLRGIRGIGAWSASFVLVRGLGRMERIAPEDALRRSLARVYGYTFSDAEFAAKAEQYGDMQGYWAHYLRIAT